jgi:hypothetical protein
MIIDESDVPSNFTFYHNGVAIVAERIETNGSTVKLFSPRVLNGAQTVMSLKKFDDDLAGNVKRRTYLDQLGKIKVIARIIQTQDDDFLQRVTINNNRQSPIQPWNLRANDLIQLGYEDKFRDELAIYYERRENAFENLTDEDLEAMGIWETKAIEIRCFAKTLLGIQGGIDKMGSIGEVFERENLYRSTFRDHYGDVPARQLLALYKIQFRLTSVAGRIEECGYEKYWYIRRAKNLIWALLIQGVLNEEDFSSFAETYGESLTMEGNFSELLRRIGSTKIRPIFATAFERNPYSDYLEDRKLSFLKSDSTYDHCMQVARSMFRWEKKSI